MADYDEPEQRPPLIKRLAILGVEHVFTLLILVLALGLGLLLWKDRQTPPITDAKYELLHEGMTETEVEGTLGFGWTNRPATAPVQLLDTTAPDWKTWNDGSTVVTIAFVNGRVRYKMKTAAPPR